MDILCRQHTFNLGFGVFSIAKFWGDSQVSQRIFPPTPFPTTFILELFRVAYFGFVDLTQRIYFADTALSTFDLEFLGEPNFRRQSSFRIGSADTLPTAVSV